jgi:hypothetical protein
VIKGMIVGLATIVAMSANATDDIKPADLPVIGVLGKTVDTLRDPQSLQVESLLVITTKDAVSGCFEFRAKNGFGGYNRGYASWTLSTAKAKPMLYFGVDKPPLWNKYCANKSGVDRTADARYVVKRMNSQ